MQDRPQPVGLIRQTVSRSPLQQTITIMVSDHRQHPHTAYGTLYYTGESFLHHELINCALQSQVCDSLLIRHSVTIHDLASEELGVVDFLMAELRESQDDAQKIDDVT